MSNIKHVGRTYNNKRRLVIAYRVVPGEPDNCIAITTENLAAEDHDALMKAVESAAGQEANDFATVMARTSLPDGSNMLARFHTTGKMIKIATNAVEMVPNRNTTIRLSELNEMVAQQQGVSVEDLAIQTTTPIVEETTDVVKSTETISTEPVQQSTDGVLTDEELAAQYRSQADAMFKEAKRLREQAEELSPTKKRTTKKKTETSA